MPLLSEMKSTGDDHDPETVFKSWLKERFNEFVGLLVEAAVSSLTDEVLKVRVFHSIGNLVSMVELEKKKK